MGKSCAASITLSGAYQLRHRGGRLEWRRNRYDAGWRDLCEHNADKPSVVGVDCDNNAVNVMNDIRAKLVTKDPVELAMWLCSLLVSSEFTVE